MYKPVKRTPAFPTTAARTINQAGGHKMAITVKKLKFLASQEKGEVSAILMQPRGAHGRPWVQYFEADTRVR